MEDYVLRRVRSFPPTCWWNWFTLSFGGQQALNSLIMVLPTLGPMNYMAKGIQHVGGIWDIENHIFISWNEAHTKFNLIVLDIDDWTLLTTKIINLWKHRLQDDPFITHPGQWVGFYIEDTNGPVFVLSRLAKFTCSCEYQLNMSLPFMDKW